MAEAKWTGVLSTTEPRNDVGIIKVRQGNINSEIAEFQIVQNNKPYDLTGLTVYFCASFGLNLVEKPAVVINTTGGRIQYTFDDDSMQSVGRQKGYFSIKKAESKIDSTQEFEFQVESSIMTRSIDGKSYIYKLSTLIKVLDDFIKNGQNNFNTWFDSVKEILYGVDPGGNILRELIEARKNSSGNIFASLKARLDKNEDDTAAQFAQMAIQLEPVKIPEVDDTARLLRTIEKLPETGGVIALPQGETLTSGLLEVTKKNVTLLTSGGTTIKLKNGANSSLLWVKEGADDFQCFNVKFDGNAEQQVQDITTGTPFGNNSALVLIQSHRPFLSNVIAQNTKLRGIMISAYKDEYSLIENPVIINCKAKNTTGDGISITFAKKPLITGSSASRVGGRFVKVSSIDSFSKTITVNELFTHKINEKIGVFKIGIGYEDEPVFLGSVTKRDNPIDLLTFTVSDLRLVGGKGNLEYQDNLYLMSAENGANGIGTSNCHSSKIIACDAEYTSFMGISTIQDRGSSAIISNCHVKCSGEEGQILDGCRAGKIIGGSTESTSINSTAPNYHISNVSPGITNPEANTIESCTGYNDMGGVNTGVHNGTTLINPSVKNVKLYRDPSFNWNDAVGIQTTGVPVVNGCEVYHYEQGFSAVGGDVGKVKGNVFVGLNIEGAAGMKSVNASRTLFEENVVQKFKIAFSVIGQGGYKISRNTLIECSYALDTPFGLNSESTDTYYLDNNSDVLNLFKNDVPSNISDKAFDVYTHKDDIRKSRAAYTNAVVFQIDSGGYLKVVADGGFTFPSEKIYRIFSYNGGPKPYVLVPLSVAEIDSATISSTAAIDAQGNVEIKVTGTGGEKGLQYVYSRNLLNL